MIIRSLLILTVLVGEVLIGEVVADEVASRIMVNGRSEVVLTRGSILLEDLAEISSEIGADDSILQLKKIKVGVAPSPGKRSQIDAQLVVDRMREAGVDFKKVIYTFPREIGVQRAGRVLPLDEAERLVDQALKASGRDLSIRSAKEIENITVPPSLKNISSSIISLRGTDCVISLRGELPETETFTLPIKVQVDEWRDVPVAARPLDKGATIANEDLVMARMKNTSLPRDFVKSTDSIVGYVTSSRIGIGEVFQQTKVQVPALVTAGSRVTMIFRSKLFEASASGVALESGGIGQEVKVRNDQSKKVVSGRVNESGIVVVSPN